MLTEIRHFLKREVLHKTRDIAIDPVGPAFGGSIIGFPFLPLILGLLVLGGIVFAIIMIVKISKKKKQSQIE